MIRKTESKDAETLGAEIPQDKFSSEEMKSGKSKSTGESIAHRVWDHGEVHHNGKKYLPGQTIQLTAEEAALLGDAVKAES